jgi:hypothetical protein
MIDRPILPPLGALFRSPAPNVPFTPHPPSPRSIPINNIILAA